MLTEGNETTRWRKGMKQDMLLEGNEAPSRWWRRLKQDMLMEGNETLEAG